VTGEVELAPEDIVELGRGGPKFAFDLEPRPQHMAARTRVLSAVDAANATRAISTAAATAASTADLDLAKGTKEMGGFVKPAVGKETVMRMLFQERQKSSRVWMSSIAAVLAVLVVSGAGFYWHNRNVANELALAAAQQAEKARADAQANLEQTLGASAKAIVNKFGNSSVVVEVLWRMYDSGTGRPLFHRVVFDPRTKEAYPAFVRLPNGQVVRWLTVEDGERLNIPVSQSKAGSGFVISENGFILTNKHVAASWMGPYREVGASRNSKGLIYPYDLKMDGKVAPEVVSLNSTEIRRVASWIPGDGGYVFRANAPVVIGGSVDNRRVFRGQNDLLEVRFPGSRVGLQATLSRASTDADAALIKVESAQPLKPVELAVDDKVEVGDRVVVLGYPAISGSTLIEVPSSEGGRISRGVYEVHEPTLTEGIVSLISTPFRREGDVTVAGPTGDTYQMTINSTGSGNSGGPVFNAKGQVVGLFTYSASIQGDAHVTYAVPIKYGRALLSPQRANAN
jgi:S1-C subfamily serine protease